MRIRWRGAVELAPNKPVVRFFLRQLKKIYTILFRIHPLVALISGVMTAFSFYLIGIPYPITLGILIVIFDPLLALAVLLLGLIFVILIPEYFIRPQLASLSVQVYHLVVILAFTSNVFVVGPAGVIVGPTVYGIVLAAYSTRALSSQVTSWRSKKRLELLNALES